MHPLLGTHIPTNLLLGLRSSTTQPLRVTCQTSVVRAFLVSKQYLLLAVGGNLLLGKPSFTAKQYLLVALYANLLRLSVVVYA